MTVLLWATSASAHRPGLSYARVEAEQVTLTFAAAELTGHPVASVSVDGAPCTVGPVASTPVESDGVELVASLDCPAGEQWTYHADYLGAFVPGHRQVLEAFGHSVAVLDASRPSADFHPRDEGSALTVAGDFVVLGVEHILTGFDHLAFLLGLLLAARGLKEMALVVSGFTIAHSITLALAALDVVHVPSWIVEPAIALSIAFVAIENFYSPPAKRRLALTFALGLLHGFGFAGILAELGLPAGQVAVALVSFNVGVELGQLAVVLPLLPVLLKLRENTFWREKGIKALSALLALAGLAWFFERVLAA